MIQLKQHYSKLLRRPVTQIDKNEAAELWSKGETIMMRESSKTFDCVSPPPLVVRRDKEAFRGKTLDDICRAFELLKCGEEISIQFYK